MEMWLDCMAFPFTECAIKSRFKTDQVREGIVAGFIPDLNKFVSCFD